MLIMKIEEWQYIYKARLKMDGHGQKTGSLQLIIIHFSQDGNFLRYTPIMKPLRAKDRPSDWYFGI